jgi:hypothetical protein
MSGDVEGVYQAMRQMFSLYARHETLPFVPLYDALNCEASEEGERVVRKRGRRTGESESRGRSECHFRWRKTTIVLAVKAKDGYEWWLRTGDTPFCLNQRL